MAVLSWGYIAATISRWLRRLSAKSRQSDQPSYCTAMALIGLAITGREGVGDGSQVVVHDQFLWLHTGIRERSSGQRLSQSLPCPMLGMR